MGTPPPDGGAPPPAGAEAPDAEPCPETADCAAGLKVTFVAGPKLSPPPEDWLGAALARACDDTAFEIADAREPLMTDMMLLVINAERAKRLY
jgi:hypothetical protein